jgi:hypothetical protein
VIKALKACLVKGHITKLITAKQLVEEGKEKRR